MTSGLPDYFRESRPRYGAAKIAIKSTEATANTKISLVSVSGKGVIYGGMVFVDGEVTQIIDIPILSIEGVELTSENFATLNTMGATKEHSYPLYLLKCDDTLFFYTVGILPGITFDTGFEVLYDERHQTTPWVSCWVLYALI